jgi:hypothetical protein
VMVLEHVAAALHRPGNEPPGEGAGADRGEQETAGERADELGPGGGDFGDIGTYPM